MRLNRLTRLTHSRCNLKDMFGPRVGFLKIKCDVFDTAGKRVPGICVSNASLDLPSHILVPSWWRCGRSSRSSLQRRTIHPSYNPASVCGSVLLLNDGEHSPSRVPIGASQFPEIPAGMIVGGGGVCENGGVLVLSNRLGC